MGELSFKIGRYEAEALTAMVQTDAGPLFLSRVLPGRWAIMRPGTPEGEATPAWGGKVDGFVASRVPFFPTDRVEEEIGFAADWMAEEAEGASPGN